MKREGSIFYMIFSIATAMISNTITGSIFWAIMSFLFTPIAWIKWLIYEEITMTVLQQTFPWFFK